MDVRHQLNGTTFLWNVEKARFNLRNHGVAFEEAAEVFFDPFFRLVDAGRNDEAREAVQVAMTLRRPH